MNKNCCIEGDLSIYVILLGRVASRKFSNRKIDSNFLLDLIQSTDQSFYICGPKQFEEDIKTHLMAIGVTAENIQTGYKF